MRWTDGSPMKIVANSADTICTFILSSPSLTSTSSVETPRSVLYGIAKDDPGPSNDDALRKTDMALTSAGVGVGEVGRRPDDDDGP